MSFEATKGPTARLGTKAIKFWGITFTEWEVLLGGGIVCTVVGAVTKGVHFLLWVGLALIALWVLAVILVNLGILRPVRRKPRKPRKPRKGGGVAPAVGPDQTSPPPA